LNNRRGFGNLLALEMQDVFFYLAIRKMCGIADRLAQRGLLFMVNNV
jgi:hypothetical protein